MEIPDNQPQPQAQPEAAGEERAELAGFWVRGGAFFVDFVALFFLGLILSWVLKAPDFIGFFTGLAYKALFTANGGQTPGKMAAGIRVITVDGYPVSLPRSIARALLEYVSAITLFIGYAIAASPTKRTLHDYAAGTLVVYVPDVGAGRRAAFALLGLILSAGFLIVTFTLGGTFGKFKTLHDKAGEGATKGNLGTLRAASAIKYGDLEGRYPTTLEEVLLPEMKGIPETSLMDHPKSSKWTAYGNEVCLPGKTPGSGEIDPQKVGDTGGWGYVTDEKSPCWGTVFVDCSHKDTKGKFWPEY